MCTVSLLPGRAGFLLAMNRDEQKSRVAALPPQIRKCGERSSLYPSESGGGTWIGVNDAGLVLALINWYEKPQAPKRVSRGIVIPRLLAAKNLNQAGAILSGLPLESLNPFRLIGLSLAARAVKEWRWDGATCDSKKWGWKRHHWFSSGYDEPKVQSVREKLVAEASGRRDEDWLRRLHRAHSPRRGPFSICMHRAEAETVSYLPSKSR